MHVKERLSVMERFTAGNIKIDGICNTDVLLEWEITAEVNNHCYMEYTGLIRNKDTAHAALKSKLSNNTIRCYVHNTLVFCGYPTFLDITDNVDTCIIHVIAISFTKNLDVYPSDYFFQDVSQSYANTIEKAFGKHNGALISTAGNTQIGKPILQYRETSWQYALRISSKLGVVLTPNKLSNLPQACLGISNGTKREVSNIFKVLTQQSFYSLMQRDNWYQDTVPGDFQCYRLEDEKLFNLGDRIILENSELSVVRLNNKLINGIIVNNYAIGKERLFAPPLFENEKQVGLSLEGVVIDVCGEELKLRLDIPDDANNNKAYWFYFSPETCNGMYSMPPRNTRVALEWKNSSDGDARVIRCVRVRESLREYEYRSLKTEYGKVMEMMPDKVAYFSDSNTLLLNKGIRKSTEKRMRIKAKKNVMQQSHLFVRYKTPEELAFAKANTPSSMLMSAQEIHVKSPATTTASGSTKPATFIPAREIFPGVTVNQDVAMKISGMRPVATSMGE